jgi:hypothetical protein
MYMKLKKVDDARHIFIYYKICYSDGDDKVRGHSLLHHEIDI